MATLAVSRDLFTDISKLEKTVRAAVSKLAETFQKSTAQDLRNLKGVHLEPYTGGLDDRARTVRIGDNHRGVVLDVGDDETFILTKIDTHDKVDHWMMHNRFKVNEATGALEIVNAVAISDAVASVSELPELSTEQKLYAHRSDKDFRQLGIEEDLLPALRAFAEEEQLLGILPVLPPNQANALILLLGDEDVQVLYAQVAGEATKPEAIDPTDVVAAVTAPASQEMFHVVADESELQDMLAQPLAQWRTYLHTSQREIAYRDTYNGPARVTGGAGTGKTVVAMHRAKHLGDQLPDRSGKPILFTTFTRNLSDAIERDLRSLGGPELLEVVDVLNVDRLARQVVAAEESSKPKIADDTEVEEIWRDVVDELDLPYKPEFLKSEYEQVVLAQGIASQADYFAAKRPGRGVRLARRNRKTVWTAVEAFLRELTARGKRTYLQMADAAAGYLVKRTLKPYAHVLVDEAQDLHEAQWRMLRAAVAEGPNDLFLVGDAYQRIYDRRASLAQVGINIVGRSKRLRINYRTTHEILRWALAFLGESSYEDEDDQTLANYHSFLHGPVPTMVGSNAKQEQLQVLAAQITEWINGGVPEEEIVVAARTGLPLDGVEHALKQHGILTLRLKQDAPVGDGVRLGGMHRLKGTEFRCVAIVDMSDDQVPLPYAVTSPSVDAVQHDVDLRRERCTAYVAATRARDDLWVGWSGKPSRFLEPLLQSAED